MSRKVGTARRLSRNIAHAAGHEAALAGLGGLGERVGDHAVLGLERHEPLDGLTRGARIEGQADGSQALLEDHQLAAVLPDEGRQARQRDLRAQAVLVDPAIAVEVQRERLRGGQEVVPGPVVGRVGAGRRPRRGPR